MPLNDLRVDFKLSRGILPIDILKKTISLRSVHTISTTEDDLKIFQGRTEKQLELKDIHLMLECA